MHPAFGGAVGGFSMFFHVGLLGIPKPCPVFFLLAVRRLCWVLSDSVSAFQFMGSVLAPSRHRIGVKRESNESRRVP